MASDVLTWALLFGAFIALMCSVIYALSENMKNRKEILSLLGALPQVEELNHDEVLGFIESRRLYGKGIGWIDAHLLASTLVSQASLWTKDKRLAKVAESMDILLATS